MFSVLEKAYGKMYFPLVSSFVLRSVPALHYFFAFLFVSMIMINK